MEDWDSAFLSLIVQYWTCTHPAELNQGQARQENICVFRGFYTDIRNKKLKLSNAIILPLPVALLLFPSQPEPVTSVKETRSGQGWHTGCRVVQVLNWPREFRSITSHTPLHSPVSCLCVSAAQQRHWHLQLQLHQLTHVTRRYH